MGCCISCQSNRRVNQSGKGSSENLEQLIINPSFKYEPVAEIVTETGIDSTNDRIQTEYYSKNEHESIELLTDEIFNYGDTDEEQAKLVSERDIGILIAKPLTYTSESVENICKRKKSSQLTEKYLKNPEICENVNLEESYIIKDPHYHKKISFIDQPLTLEDIADVLSNSEQVESEKTTSPLSFDSSLLSALSETSEVNQSLLYPDSEPCNWEVHNNGSDIKGEQDKDYSDRQNDLFQKEIDNKGPILNSVPASYDDFKKMKKKTTNGQHRRRAYTDTNSSERGLFSVLFDINSKRQNIIHQMVMKNDMDGALTLFSCLAQIKQLSNFLDLVDIYGNTPIAYCIQSGDISMTKLLLKHHSALPSTVYSVTEHQWIPIMHSSFNLLKQLTYTSDFENSMFSFICSLIASFDNKNAIGRQILETKNKDGLTILHYAIVKFEPKIDGDDENQSTKTETFVSYLCKLGSSLQTVCQCPSKDMIKVDALGQLLFSKYPEELYEILDNTCDFKSSGVKLNYVIDNINYSIEELFSMRNDVTPKSKENIFVKLQLLKKCLIEH